VINYGFAIFRKSEACKILLHNNENIVKTGYLQIMVAV